MALAFQAQIIAHNKDITIILNVGSVFVNPDLNLVDLVDFTGFSVTHIIVTPHNLVSQEPGNVTNFAVVTATTQALTAANIDSNISLAFNS